MYTVMLIVLDARKGNRTSSNTVPHMVMSEVVNNIASQLLKQLRDCCHRQSVKQHHTNVSQQDVCLVDHQQTMLRVSYRTDRDTYTMVRMFPHSSVSAVTTVQRDFFLLKVTSATRNRAKYDCQTKRILLTHDPKDRVVKGRYNIGFLLPFLVFV